MFFLQIKQIKNIYIEPFQLPTLGTRKIPSYLKIPSLKYDSETLPYMADMKRQKGHSDENLFKE